MFCCADPDSDKTEAVLPPASELSVQERVGAPEADPPLAEPTEVKEPEYEPKKEEPVKAEPEPEKPKEAQKVTTPAGKSFQCTVSRGTGTLGMSVDSHGSCLIVTGILPGAIKDYNDTAALDQQVSTHDFITEVNTEVDPGQMVAELKGKSQLKMKLLRCVPFNITVNKGGKTLGIRLAYSPTSTSVGITEVLDGAVKDYNASGIPDALQLKVNDRILTVNGVAGSADELIQTLKIGDTTAFSVVRPVP